jgi:uncharacterized protein (TIGR02117 family)
VTSRTATKVERRAFVKQHVYFDILRILKTLLLLLFVPACAFPTQEPHIIRAETRAKVIYVVSHGWHTGIVLKTEEIPKTIVWPELADFAGNQYIEVGWGDWNYYQAPETTWVTALKAALWSTRSVLHMAGFDEPVKTFFPASDVIEVPLTEAALKELSGFIAGTNLRMETEEKAKIRPGLYGNGRFYPAEGRFHVFHNCNTWVADALRAGGLPMNQLTITASSVMAQVRDFVDEVEGHPN